jgi:hypothetical protein
VVSGLPAQLAVPQRTLTGYAFDGWGSVQEQYPNEISKAGDQP